MADVVIYFFIFLNMQVLEFRVSNILHGTNPFEVVCHLTPGSSLSWFGFIEECPLTSYSLKILIVFMIKVRYVNKPRHTWVYMYIYI